MKLENVVPWGRDLEEYKAMRLYKEHDKKRKILGCGDGPASVNATLSKMGVDIRSIDPIYQFSKAEIKKRVEETSHTIIEELRKNRDHFIWKNIKDIDELIATRMSAMEIFLEDYDEGKEQRRYLHEELPRLSFESSSFDLAWSSHFLFLYSEHFDLAFHKAAILEMLRVAKEVRIFPLLELNNTRSRHLEAVMSFLEEEGFLCDIIKSEYEFQKGADEMLRIVRREDYLQESDVVNFSHPDIAKLAKELSHPFSSDEEVARRCFEYVRDEIHHSGDYKDEVTTLVASDVLQYGTGWCYAKSILLAALLRANGIPTAFHYQRLHCSEYEEDLYCLHGLNAIYLKEYGWYRVDARGNREGIDAEFIPPYAKLAFELEDGESDLDELLSEPLNEVVEALEKYKTYSEIIENFPDLESER